MVGHNYGYQDGGQQLFNSRFEVNIDKMWWQLAEYARNEMQADCPEYAWRYYLRMDRLRWVSLNKYCRKVDSTANFCAYDNIMHNDNGQIIRFPRKEQLFKDLFDQDKPMTNQPV